MLNLKLPLDVQRVGIGNKIVKWLSPDGKVYASDLDEQGLRRKLVVTSDWGESWEDVADFPAPITQVRTLDDGDVLVTCRPGGGYPGPIFKGNKDDGFNFVHTIEDGYVYDDFGLHVYGPIVVVGTYGNPVISKVYMSNAFGEEGSWSTIWTAPHQHLTHIHDVKFDPYEGLIWIAHGDGQNRDRVWWSDNYGGRWETLPLLDRIRATQIIPLPDRVLFGSDESFEGKVHVHLRPKDGPTMGAKMEAAWRKHLFVRNFTAVRRTWMTNAAITYGKDAMAFFGFSQPRTEAVLPSAVWATDGKTYWPIWIEEKLPSRSSGERVGVEGVYGPDENGNLAVDLKTTYGADENHLLKIALTEH